MHIHDGFFLFVTGGPVGITVYVQSTGSFAEVLLEVKKQMLLVWSLMLLTRRRLQQQEMV